MVELEYADMITDHCLGEEVPFEEEPIEPEEPTLCCRCGQVLGSGHEIFDVDSCCHSVCVACRFKDNVRCLQCNTAIASDCVTQVDTKDNVDPFILKTSCLTRKKVNLDHIVDVNDSSVQKQMCTVCQRVFKKTNARYHYACVTGEKPFACDECGQKFVKKSHMEVHLNSHFGIKPFKCSVGKCKASFAQKDKLTRHIKSHDKEEKYLCPVCDKAYSSQPILSVHMAKVHSSVKPFQCEQCPRAYKYQRSLRVHRLKHQATRELMCEVCGKKFALFAQLKHHKRSHVLYHRRPHKCSFAHCLVRFMTRRDRARHELIHSNTSRDFECSLCNTTFGRKDNLERHMKNFHQESPQDAGNVSKLTAAVSPFNRSLKDKISSKIVKKQEDSKRLEETTKLFVKIIKDGKTKKSIKPKKSTKQNHKNYDTNQIERIISCKNSENKTNTTAKPSVIKSTNQSDYQNRPTVIKNVPKLLPYRILPPDKRFLKMTEEITKGKSPSEVTPISAKRKSPYGGEPHTSQAPKQRIPKDDALNRCFRIIRHTSAVQVRQVSAQTIPLDNQFVLSKRLEDNLSTVMIDKTATGSAVKLQTKFTRRSSEQQMAVSAPSCSFTPDNGQHFKGIAEQISVTESHLLVNNLPVVTVSSADTESPNTHPLNHLGGPSLAANDINNEDNFTNSYVSLGESYSSYTPYFDNECFRESVNNYYEGNAENLLPNDLDIGFQYINEQLGCAEMNFSGESRIIRHVSQETNVIRESFG